MLEDTNWLDGAHVMCPTSSFFVLHDTLYLFIFFLQKI